MNCLNCRHFELDESDERFCRRRLQRDQEAEAVTSWRVTDDSSVCLPSAETCPGFAPSLMGVPIPQNPRCPHRRVVPQPRQDDGTIWATCEDCGCDPFILFLPMAPDACPGCEGELAGLVDRVCKNCAEQLGETFAHEHPQLEAIQHDLERALEHWPRLKPLYGEEQTEATSALTEIGLCIGEAKEKLSRLRNGE